MADPALPPVPPPTGLINSAPGLINQTPGTPPASGGPGIPVTSYVPEQATATNAATTTYAPKAFEVAPNATVASQLKGIIDSGSPLMQQAEANARQAMNARGLINSSQAITAGQDAVIRSALPIASADAATYDRAATNTTTAGNTALQFGAQAQNTAGLQNAQLGTQTSQFNTGQSNAALKGAADASNQIATIAQQIQGSKDVQEIQGATSRAIADLQASTSISLQDKQAAVQQLIAALQSNTQLDIQDRANAVTLAKSAADNLSAQTVATIQTDASKSIAQQQADTQRYVAGLSSDTQRAVQELQNAGNLANIRANGEINTAITQLTNDNKLLLQTSQGAQNIYSQMLQNLSNILTNPNLSADNKTRALNDGVQQLNDALSVMSTIAGIPELQSTLVFGDGAGSAAFTPPPPAPYTPPPPGGPQTGGLNPGLVPGGDNGGTGSGVGGDGGTGTAP